MINVDIILHFIMIEATFSHIHFCLLSSNIKICKICKYEYVKGRHFPAMLLAQCMSPFLTNIVFQVNALLCKQPLGTTRAIKERDQQAFNYYILSCYIPYIFNWRRMYRHQKPNINHMHGLYVIVLSLVYIVGYTPYLIF